MRLCIEDILLENLRKDKKMLSMEEIRKASETSDEAALDCCIQHWKELVEDIDAVDEYYGYHYSVSCKTCALCTRHKTEYGRSNCSGCPLFAINECCLDDGSLFAQLNFEYKQDRQMFLDALICFKENLFCFFSILFTRMGISSILSRSGGISMGNTFNR